MLFVAVVGVAGVAGLALWARAGSSTGSAPGADAGAAEADDEPAAPIEDDATVRSRYQPGPFVQVVGVLPRGAAERARRRQGARTGHTIDTPWIVSGAELRGGGLPTATAGAPTTRLVDAAPSSPLTVIPGVPTHLEVAVDDDPRPDGAVRGFLVAYEGYPGHFFLPSATQTELGPVAVAGANEASIVFGLDTPLRPDGALHTGPRPFATAMLISTVDLGGRVSTPVRRSLEVLPLGTGDVEVTLTMTRATDLDLYVTDASGIVTFYGHRQSATGGQLDLDANAACSGNMGVNNEHVFWPRGMSPAGQYTVRVANYQSCIQGEPVDYRITVRNCGETAVLAGRFEGPGTESQCVGPPGDARGWCQDVVSFPVAPCAAVPPRAGTPSAPMP